MNQAIILVSGGVDSYVTAWYVKKRFKNKYKKIKLLFFDYGQKACKEELFCVKKLAKQLNSELKIMNSGWLGEISTSLINRNKKTGKNETIKWYVPCRNSIFLLIALAHAESDYLKKKIKSDIFIGIKYEGELCFNDTTPKFLKKINGLAKICVQKGSYGIKAPFIDKDKEELIELADKMGLDLESTYSCYLGGIGNKKLIHCGVCAGCEARKKGFKFSNIKDPSTYKIIKHDI